MKDSLEKACLAFDRRDEPGKLEEATALARQYHADSGLLARCYALSGHWDEALVIWEQQALSGRLPSTEQDLDGWDREAFLMSHQDISEPGEVDFGELLHSAIHECRSHFADDSIQVGLKGHSTSLVICGARENLRTVLLVLLENAFEAILEPDRTISCSPCWYTPLSEVGKCIRPRIDLILETNEPGNQVTLTCRDYGIGLPFPWRTTRQETQKWINRRKHVFAGDVERTRLFLRGCQPFDEKELAAWLFFPGWTSKGKGWTRTRASLRNGPGMGLYMARQILRRHHGSIEIRRPPSCGTMVQIKLPAVSN